MNPPFIQSFDIFLSFIFRLLEEIEKLSEDDSRSTVYPISDSSSHLDIQSECLLSEHSAQSVNWVFEI